ncbi:MAG: carbohydrate-binding domain-containing protein [Lachnospiraceae bacterium]|nr:carbohydrate-binding domain-containing protein [Lachnospiraceae bacterium]
MRRTYKNNHKLHITLITVGACTMLALTGCSAAKNSNSESHNVSGSKTKDVNTAVTYSSGSSSSEETIAATVQSADGAILDTSELFSDRDLTQMADLSEAVYYTVSNGEDIHITSEGVYVVSGSAKNVTIYVEAASEDKVQLVLNDLSITNDDFPCIYVKEADKVFVTTSGTENTLSVTGSFAADGDTNTDGVIFSRSDLVLNGTGGLTINSTDNGVVGKDDLKITGGTYTITASSKAFEANDSIRIAAGTFHLTAGTDALHAENDEDDTLGYIYIAGGTYTIQAGDDGIHAESVLEIDGGTIDITAAEGLEATYIQINEGTVNIQASDDGINAANKSSSYTPTVEINGGDITVSMGAGDTDGIDSNGNIIINGGTVNVTGNSTFDYDGTGVINGGTVIVNGEEVDSLPNQFMGGPGGMNNGMFPGGGWNDNDGNGGSLPSGGERGGRMSNGTYPGGGRNNGTYPNGGWNNGEDSRDNGTNDATVPNEETEGNGKNGNGIF